MKKFAPLMLTIALSPALSLADATPTITAPAPAAPAAAASTATPDDMKLIDTFNRYRASIYVAELCPASVEKFKDTEQEKKFQKNFWGVTLAAMQTYKKIKPDTNQADMTSAFKSMDEKVTGDIKGIFDKSGCDSAEMKEMAGWHKAFADAPAIPGLPDQPAEKTK